MDVPLPPTTKQYACTHECSATHVPNAKRFPERGTIFPLREPVSGQPMRKISDVRSRSAMFGMRASRMAASARGAGLRIALLLIATCIRTPLLRWLDRAGACRVRALPGFFGCLFIRRAHRRHEWRNRIARRKGFLQCFVQGMALMRFARRALARTFLCRRHAFTRMRQILAISGHCVLPLDYPIGMQHSSQNGPFTEGTVAPVHSRALFGCTSVFLAGAETKCPGNTPVHGSGCGDGLDKLKG